MPEQMMNGCRNLEALFEDYLCGELPRAEANCLAAHLDACRACREALEDARLAARLVGVFGAVGEPGLGFTRHVMAHVSVAERWFEEQKSFWRPIEAWSWRLAFSAALALALLFAYDLRQAPPQSNVSATATATATVFAQRSDVVVVPASAPPSSGDEVLMAIAERHHGQ